MSKYEYFLGIDEAGRGPLAGPVSIGGVILKMKKPLAVKKNFKLKIKDLEGIKDSKKLTAKKREEWYEKLTNEKSEFHCDFILINNKFIDEKGISQALKEGIAKLFKRFEEKININADNCFVLLDGLLEAPVKYSQESFFKGDEKFPLISAASVMAKVGRDHQMMHWHERFPEYCFDQHKGYGTKLHFEKIREHGFSEIHRKSFCKTEVPTLLSAKKQAQTISNKIARL